MYLEGALIYLPDGPVGCSSMVKFISYAPPNIIDTTAVLREVIPHKLLAD